MKKNLSFLKKAQISANLWIKSFNNSHLYLKEITITLLLIFNRFLSEIDKSLLKIKKMWTKTNEMSQMFTKV